MRCWAGAIAIGLLVWVGEIHWPGDMAHTMAQWPLGNRAAEASAPPTKDEADRLFQASIQAFQSSLFQEALHTAKEALQLYQALGERSGEASTLLVMGNAYNFLGQYQASIEHYQQSLVLSRMIADRQSEAHALGSLGITYQLLGHYDRAIEHLEQALAMTRSVGDRLGEANSLGNLGTVHNFLGDYQRAIEYFDQVLALMKELENRPGQAIAFGNLGTAYHALGQEEQAIRALENSLLVSREVGDLAAEGAALNTLGLVERHRGNYAGALENYEKALAIRRRVGDREGEGGTLYNIAVVYQDLNQLEQAKFYAYESLRLIEAIEGDLRPEDLDRILFLETRLHTYDLLTNLLVKQENFYESLEIVDRGRARSLVEFLNPSTAEQPRLSLSVVQIKQMARDRRATILIHAIIGKEIYIWAVTPVGEIAFEKVDPEALGIPLTAVADRARQAANFPLNDLAFSQDKYRLDLQATRGAGEDGLFAEDPEHLKRIYRLLIQPIEAHLPNDPGARLLIVPHRELSAVPFAALLDGRDRFLVDRYAISVTPSLQVLDTVSRQRPAAIGPALVVGNPSPMPADDDGVALDPLPGAATEANAIAAALNTTPLLNRQATETAVKQQLATARILHLATHGVLETDDRGVETAWLALGPDGQNDGKLDLSEVFDSNLSAELAVLSACDTNRGQVTGEGVIGLGRAFLKAGTPTVVASLWKVPDEQTALLMEAFYGELLAGRDRADALRLAQLKVREQYPNPRYWAAFVLIGEGDRPLDPP